MSRSLTNEEKKELLSLKPEDITLEYLKVLFANTTKSKPKYNPTDQFSLDANEYYNKSAVLTTVGRLIFNKVVLEGSNTIEYIGYKDMVIDNKSFNNIDRELVNLVRDEKMPIKNLYDYFDQINWLAYAPTYFIVPSLDTSLYIIDPEVRKLKEKLMNEHKEAIANADLAVIADIENQLIALSKEKTKDVPGRMIYDSGSRGSFGNNYKNSVLMRGGIKNFKDPSTFDCSMNSLCDGISKEDFDKFSNILTAGVYARAKNTEIGGYMVKQARSAYQHLMLDEPGSDCGSTKYIQIDINKSNIKYFILRYALTNKGLLLIEDSNKDLIMNKKIKFRSPMYCKNEKICSKCAGELYYRMGVMNVGELCDRIASTIMQKSMKAFHDSSIKMSKVDYESYLKEI
jgi:hypothetical protein